MRRLLAAALLVACGGSLGIDGVGGSSSRFGGSSPWGSANATYGGAEGILEQPVIGASTDEAQNLWVATRSALYLLKPGEPAFRRFTAADVV